jgi:hypothetical protein
MYPQQPPQQFQQPQQQYPHQTQQPMQAPPSRNPQQAAQQLQQIGRAATHNIMAGYLTQPPRAAVSRVKADDGDHVVKIVLAELKQRQAGGNMLLLEFEVVDSTVASNIGQQYGHVNLWERPFQIQDLSDLFKAVWGMEQSAQFAMSNPTPEQVAIKALEGIQALQTRGPVYAYLKVRRSQKQMREGKSYEEAFANHNWGFFTNEAFTLAAMGVHSAANAAPAVTQAQQFQQPAQPQFPPQPQPQFQPQPQPQFQQPAQPQFQQAPPQPQFQQSPLQPQFQTPAGIPPPPPPPQFGAR